MPHGKRTPAALVSLLATAAVSLSGCGIEDPLNDPAPEPLSPKTTAPNEIGSPGHGRPSRTSLAAAGSTPTAAIRRFAELYITWNADTLADHQRQLAAISIGEASSTEARAVAGTGKDYELRNSHIANRGQVIAITPMLPAQHGVYMVITRERTIGTGVYYHLEPAYHLTIATVEHIAGGWAVSQWHPQA